MSVRAVSDFVTTTAQLAAPHYIKVMAAVATVTGGIWAGNRHWNLSCNRELLGASDKVKGKLDVVNPKLNNWNDGDAHDAKELQTIIHGEDKNYIPLPHLEFVGPKSHFQTAVGHVKALTTIAGRVSAAQKKWLKETKKKAEKWLRDKEELSRDASHDVTGAKDATPILIANHNLVNAIMEAKEPIKEKEVTAETIQQRMATVKEKYDVLYELVKQSDIKIHIGKSLVPIKDSFPDDGYDDLETLSADDLKDTYTAQGKIEGDDKTNVDQAIAGLAHENLLEAVDRNEEGSEAKIACDKFHKWNHASYDLYMGPKWVVGFAMLALAANWGAPYYLGDDHHIVQLFKLPA